MSFQQQTRGGLSLIRDKVARKGGAQQYGHIAFYVDIARSEANEVLQQLGNPGDGLDETEASERYGKYGPNEIAQEKYHWPKQLLKAALNPFILLLAVLALISYLTDDLRGAIVMASMVAVSLTLTFFQEHRSSRAAEKLKEMVSTNATVLRKGEGENAEKREVPISQIVPGDLVLLSAGDMLPADLRLIVSKDLFVAQAALTGESLPIEKTSVTEASQIKDPLDARNLCFMGSNVVSGTAMGVVLKTGGETYVGSMAEALSQTRTLTSFEQGINRFTALMLKFMAVMVPLVFLINGFTKGNWFDAFLFAVAVAVGLTPEMLPMIVTVNLAKGALSMAKKKVIVKRLNSIQNFGAMDVLCTDKTGTLTQDKVILEKYVDGFGSESGRVLKYAYLNSYFQTGLKNLLDVAILKHVEVKGELGIERNYKKLDEIPFDFSRKRMSVVVEKQNSRHILICKGALEEVFKLCSHAEMENETRPIAQVSEARLLKIAQDLNEDGLRVIAVAYKDVPAVRKEYAVADESELTLLGFIAFLDPPKESAGQAIEALARYGVRVKVLTGDNDRVTRKICKEVGIDVERIVLGHEIEAMSDSELDAVVDQVSIFAKLNPNQKQRIVQILRDKGHVVGFMGDGINDAPALTTADVGISVDNAVDIAKESADIILLEKSLLVLEEGVLEGRKVFGNIIKYIKMGASSNFGNVFSMLGASSILPFLPMQPVQLLAQNLLYDLSQTAIPFDEVDQEYLERPRKWEIGDITRFMVYFGPISSIFDYLTFALMWFVFQASTQGTANLFQSGWFVEGLLSQTLIVHMIRTRRVPFIQSRASLPMLLMTGVIMAIGIGIPFTGFGAKLGFVALPLSYFPWLAAMLFLYCLLTQLVKGWFIRKYGYN